MNQIVLLLFALCEKCTKREFCWSVISRIWNEYGELLFKSSHTVQIWEKMEQKKIMPALFTQCWHTLVLGSCNEN